VRQVERSLRFWKIGIFLETQSVDWKAEQIYSIGVVYLDRRQILFFMD
jgi:hypothetical protein